MEDLFIDRLGETDAMIADNDRHCGASHVQVRKPHFNLKLSHGIRWYFFDLVSFNRQASMSWHDFDLLLSCSPVCHLQEALLAVPFYQHSFDPLVLEERFARFCQRKAVFFEGPAL